jgi:hypothetical protein
MAPAAQSASPIQKADGLVGFFLMVLTWLCFVNAHSLLGFKQGFVPLRGVWY